jgi:hypothetical protein
MQSQHSGGFMHQSLSGPNFAETSHILSTYHASSKNHDMTGFDKTTGIQYKMKSYLKKDLNHE